MELHVWVDGTQRVVCGVKLTTTCQEIVFALAHATQQAGRFTMIERWRNNERLLSPNEQPLVTLQRWGDRMNEVEFILRKTSTDHPTQMDRTPINQMPNTNNQQVPRLASSSTVPQTKDIARLTSDSDPNYQSNLTNGNNNGSSNHMLSNTKNQRVKDQLTEISQQLRQYNQNRRPQTVLGPLTSSNSALNIGSSYLQTHMNRLPQSFKPSLSASTLPHMSDNMTASPSNSITMIRPRFADDIAVDNRSPSISLNDPSNGYTLQSEMPYQAQQLVSQSRVNPTTNTFQHEDLYSTINKKRNNHIPPAVPAKPRLINPISNMPHPQPAQTINTAQINYYNQTPLPMYPNVRPRHPPAYLHYLEARAIRSSLQTSIQSNPSLMHPTQIVNSNILPRQLDHQQFYRQNGSSPANSTTSTSYPLNGQSTRPNLITNYDVNSINKNIQNMNSINTKYIDSSGLIINRGSAINVKLNPNSQPLTSQNTKNENLNTSAASNTSSVSQIGHDMLKVIEEQKKVLMKQKSELDRFDEDQEYLEAKQSLEQTELINRVKSEIRQLEELWGENQSQIKRLENQDFERELHHLKTEQVRMELELASQKKKLAICEADIAECQFKIERLEAELRSLDSESDESIVGSEKSNHSTNSH